MNLTHNNNVLTELEPRFGGVLYVWCLQSINVHFTNILGTIMDAGINDLGILSGHREKGVYSA